MGCTSLGPMQWWEGTRRSDISSMDGPNFPCIIFPPARPPSLPPSLLLPHPLQTGGVPRSVNPRAIRDLIGTQGLFTGHDQHDAQVHPSPRAASALGGDCPWGRIIEKPCSLSVWTAGKLSSWLPFLWGLTFVDGLNSRAKAGLGSVESF